MEISKNKLRAAKYYSPIILIMAFLFVLTLLLSSESTIAFLNLSKYETGYLNLSIITYGMPIWLIIFNAYAVHKGFSIYKTKYNPPKNIPTFKDTATKLSKCPTCFLVLSLISLIISFYLLYFGHGVYYEIYSINNT